MQIFQVLLRLPCLKGFSERFFNVGIAEQNLMATAAGLATTGKIPFASTFAIFATGRAYEIIRILLHTQS